MHELGLFIQDTWHPHERVTLDMGLRWDGAWHPNVFIEPADTFFAPYLNDPLFPSDGRIPDDLDNLQPRLGLAWDLTGKGRTVLRANAGSYVARIPMLVFAQHRTTNGAFQQILFRSSNAPGLGPVPAIDEQIDTSASPPFLPDIQVADRDLELPRTWSFSTTLDQDLGRGVAASIGYIQARTHNLFRFVNRNDAVLGAPFGIGTHPNGGGINALTVTERSARARYHALTAGLRGRSGLAGWPITFETQAVSATPGAPRWDSACASDRLEGDAVAHTGSPAPDEQEREPMLLVAESDQGVDADPVEDRHGAQILGEFQVEAADQPQPVPVGSVGQAYVRGDRNPGLVLEILAGGGEKALAAG